MKSRIGMYLLYCFILDSWLVAMDHAARTLGIQPVTVGIYDHGSQVCHHPDIVNACIRAGLFSFKIPHTDTEQHNLFVSSIIAKLAPEVHLEFFDCRSDPLYKNLETAIASPDISIINASIEFGNNMMPKDIQHHVKVLKPILQRLRQLKKVMVIAASNAQGYLGVHPINRVLVDIINEEPRVAHALIIAGASHKDHNGLETMSSRCLKAGGMRHCYLLAPGENISVPCITPEGLPSTTTRSGTSLSAACVSACLAHLMQQKQLTAFRARQLLLRAADPPYLQSAEISYADQGWGFVNIIRALNEQCDTKLPTDPFTQVYDYHMSRPWKISNYNNNMHETFLSICSFPAAHSMHAASLFDQALHEFKKDNMRQGIRMLYDVKSIFNELGNDDCLSTALVYKRDYLEGILLPYFRSLYTDPLSPVSHELLGGLDIINWFIGFLTTYEVKLMYFEQDPARRMLDEKTAAHKLLKSLYQHYKPAADLLKEHNVLPVLIQELSPANTQNDLTKTAQIFTYMTPITKRLMGLLANEPAQKQFLATLIATARILENAYYSGSKHLIKSKDIAHQIRICRKYLQEYRALLYPKPPTTSTPSAHFLDRILNKK